MATRKSFGVGLKKAKKLRLKSFCLFCGIIAVVLVILVIMLGYKPEGLVGLNGGINKEVEEYITGELLPELYNGAQGQEPFGIEISQKNAENIVGLAKWPWESDGIKFSRPNVFFASDAIVLIGKMNIKGAELAITVVSRPFIDEQGLLSLPLTGVRIGALNITPIARVIGRKIYISQISDEDVDSEKIGHKIADSLLTGKSFEPVFEIEDKEIRIEKISLELQKLTIGFVPVFD